MIQVLVVDDHIVTRIGIKFFIEKDLDIKVIAEASEVEEGITLCTSLNPDIVLLDLHMPKLSGIEAVKTIISNQPNSKIIILTGSADKREIRDSLAAGAKGCCLKDIDYTHLIGAIKAVFSGETWIDSSIRDQFSGQLNQAADQNKSKSSLYRLSHRELQVLTLVVEGKTNQEIAVQLGLGVDTAKSHLRGIMDKLSVNDRTQAAVKAVREELI